MTSRVLGRGHGAAGAVAYVAHDAPTAEDLRPKTHGRVAGVAFRGGLPAFDPDRDREQQLQLMGRVMQSTVADAKFLKKAAGVSARGRPLQQPIETYALSWPEGARPTWPEMEAAGDSWISAQGLEDHHIVMTGHVEDGVPSHLQLVVCLVSPVDGKAHRGNKATRGSRWAQQWEEDHGGIVIPTRVERNSLRDALAQSKSRLREHAAAEADRIRATIPPHEQDRLEAELARVKATERKVLKETRAAVRAQMPATEPTRSAGARSQLTAEDRAAWSRTHDRQRRERQQLHRPTSRAARRAHPERQAALARAHRAEQCEMAREQRALRGLRQVAAQSAHVAPVLDRLLGCPPKTPAWGAPQSPQRISHLRGLVDAYQSRGTGKGRQARRTEAAAVETIVDANLLQHAEQQTTAWQKCATTCRSTTSRWRRKTAALARQLGGVTGRITAALVLAQPPATDPPPDDLPPNAFGTGLILQSVDTAIRSAHAATVLKHPPPTGPRRLDEQMATARARQAEQKALAAEQERGKAAADRIDRRQDVAVLEMPIRAAAATGRGLLTTIQAAGRVLTAPIRGFARAVADMRLLPGDGGSGAAAYDRAARTVERDLRRGLDLRNPTTSPASSGRSTGSRKPPTRPAPSRGAPVRPRQTSRGTPIPNLASAPSLAGSNRAPDQGDQTRPRR